LSIYRGLSSCYRGIQDHDQAIAYLKEGLNSLLEVFRKEKASTYIDLDLLTSLSYFQEEIFNCFGCITDLSSEDYQVLSQYLKLASFYKEVRISTQINQPKIELKRIALVNPEGAQSDIFY